MKTSRFGLLLLVLSGCSPVEEVKVGDEGIIYDDRPKADRVIVYSERFRNGFDAVPVGTKAVYLGEALPEPSITGDMIRVGIRSGKLDGQSASTLRTHWRPLAR